MDTYGIYTLIKKEMKEFKGYLERNKLYIEFLGIFAGVTALFLAIPSSNNIEANNFLGILKFTFLASFSALLLIALASLWLKISFLQGQNMERKNSLKSIYLYFIFTLISISSLSIIFNVWGYLYYAYEYSLIKTLDLLTPILSVILAKIILLLIENLNKFFLNDNDAFGGTYPRLVYIILSWIFFYDILQFFINGNQINKLMFWIFIAITTVNISIFILGMSLKIIKRKNPKI